MPVIAAELKPTCESRWNLEYFTFVDITAVSTAKHWEPKLSRGTMKLTAYGTNTPARPSFTMRRAQLSSRALETQLSALCDGGDSALDLRCDAYGLGANHVGAIARDVGFRLALHSPREPQPGVLPSSPEGATLLTNWWEGSADPIIQLQADVISVKRVPAGTPVSYGYEYHTPQETTLALVSVGFADGVPRSASGKGHINIGGQVHPIAGRIAMDQCVVDVSDTDVAVGDIATLWGGSPTLEEWAAWSGRPSGALLSHLAPRVVRRWLS